jgi:hypothetical protein
MATSAQFKTPPARLSYVQNMFTRVARKQDDGSPTKDKNGNPVTEQQVTLIFDTSADRSAFDNAVKEAIVAEWGDKAIEMAKSGLIRTPYLKGDGKEARNKTTGEIHPGLGADKWFIRVATRVEVPVRFRSPNIPAKFGAGEDEVKSGDYGFAVLHAYTWDNAKNGKGVSFGIDYLQKTRAGESLGGTGGVNVDDYFESVTDEGAAPAATSGGAGAAGLFG